MVWKIESNGDQLIEEMIDDVQYWLELWCEIKALKEWTFRFHFLFAEVQF